MDNAERLKRFPVVTPMDRKRCTGRTTRMLGAAMEALAAGRAIYVIMDEDSTRRYKKDQRYAGLRFETWASMSTSIDAEHLRMRTGAHPNCVLFVDHYAIEQRFGALLREWVRFDEVQNG